MKKFNTYQKNGFTLAAACGLIGITYGVFADTAGLFDDVLSGAVRLAGGGPAVTGKLDIRYRKATPIDQKLRFEAHLENSTGRRIKAKAKCLANGVVTAEAEALFIKIKTD